MTNAEKNIRIEELRWKKEKELLERKARLRQEKMEVRKKTSIFGGIPTSKLLIAFLFINCTIIEIFTAFITLKNFEITQYTMTNPDFTPLVTLIGAVVAEVIGYAVYSLKSMKENTAGGIVYERAMAFKAINYTDDHSGPVG
jgi:hypothetical protein